jgi:hypothetical protein
MDMSFEYSESPDTVRDKKPSAEALSDAGAEAALTPGLRPPIGVEDDDDSEALKPGPDDTGFGVWDPNPGDIRFGTFEIKAVGSKELEPTATGIDISEAASNALADLVAQPIIKLTTAGIRTLEGDGGNEAEGELVDHFSEALQDIVDPARIPAGLVEKTVTHLVSAATATLGPVGLVVAIFAGKFAGELTHQVLDADQDPAGIESAENAIELADAFADARIGRLAESKPFAEYLNDRLGKEIAAILSEDASAAASRRQEREIDRRPAITAIIAAYEVRVPASKSGPESSDDSAAVRLRPVSIAALECIPDEAVVKRWRSGSYEYLRLSDGTLVRRFVSGDHRGPWVWVKS